MYARLVRLVSSKMKTISSALLQSNISHLSGLDLVWESCTRIKLDTCNEVTQQCQWEQQCAPVGTGSVTGTDSVPVSVQLEDSAKTTRKIGDLDEYEQYSMLNALYFELTSNSQASYTGTPCLTHTRLAPPDHVHVWLLCLQEYLPMWVILACGKTFSDNAKFNDNNKVKHLPFICQTDALISELEGDECCIACRCCCSLRCRQACGQCCVDNSPGAGATPRRRQGGTKQHLLRLAGNDPWF